MRQFACASTVRPDGSEVVAIFNYDPMDSIEVKVADAVHALGPLGVKFIEVAK